MLTPKPTKPAKPRPDFPLTAHANGRWCKKIRGKVHFAGVWADPDTALRKYLDDRDDLQAGRIPRRLSATPLNVGAVVNLWLKRCDDLKTAGELRSVTLDEDLRFGRQSVEHFGVKSPGHSHSSALDHLQSLASPRSPGDRSNVHLGLVRWRLSATGTIDLWTGTAFSGNTKTSKRVRDLAHSSVDTISENRS